MHNVQSQFEEKRWSIPSVSTWILFGWDICSNSVSIVSSFLSKWRQFWREEWGTVKGDLVSDFGHLDYSLSSQSFLKDFVFLLFHINLHIKQESNHFNQLPNLLGLFGAHITCSSIRSYDNPLSYVARLDLLLILNLWP